MLNPSRPLVITLMLVALAALLLGLATDIGLFGWSLALLLALYLALAGIAHQRRPRAGSARRPA
jgi:amino acid transporter